MGLCSTEPRRPGGGGGGGGGGTGGDALVRAGELIRRAVAGLGYTGEGTAAPGTFIIVGPLLLSMLMCSVFAKYWLDHTRLLVP